MQTGLIAISLRLSEARATSQITADDVAVGRLRARAERLVGLLALFGLLEERFGKQLCLCHVQRVLVVCQRIQACLVCKILGGGTQMSASLLQGLELLMHNLIRFRHGIVLALQRTETGQDRVVDALDEDDALERIVALQ